PARRRGGPGPSSVSAPDSHANPAAASVDPGFWQAMDTLRDRNHLEQLWSAGKAPWRTWA
ncbi:MAG TPA: hypothetical protein VII01_16810, partial [Solirubrobacteraceae bacterium]